MLKKDFPIWFDDTKIFWPLKWQENYEVVETQNTTEAGTDQIIVSRYDKLSVSCEFQCSDLWVAVFAAFRDQDSISVKLYDLKTRAYKTRTMRIRNFKVTLESNSEKLSMSNGLYMVSFDLQEF
jgi:hypothetical protein